MITVLLIILISIVSSIMSVLIGDITGYSASGPALARVIHIAFWVMVGGILVHIGTGGFCE